MCQLRKSLFKNFLSQSINQFPRLQLMQSTPIQAPLTHQHLIRNAIERLPHLFEQFWLIQKHFGKSRFRSQLTCLSCFTIYGSFWLEWLAGLKQILSPNKAQTGFVSQKYVPIFVQPFDKPKRYCCPKRFQRFCKNV